MQAKLEVVGGEAKVKEIKLRLPTIIGRGKECNLRMPHPLISRQHCEIFEDAGQLKVRDLGSLNGTFINNERITEANLPSGQLLTVGAITFRAVYEAAGNATVPKEENKTVPEIPANVVTAATPSVSASPAKNTDEPLSAGDVADDLDFDFAEVPDTGPAAQPEFVAVDQETVQLPTTPTPVAAPVAAAITPAVPPAPAAASAPSAPAAKPVGKQIVIGPPKQETPTPAAKADEPLADEEEDDDGLADFLKSLGK